MPDHIQSRTNDQHPGKGKSGFGLFGWGIALVLVAVVAAILLIS